MVGFLTPTRKRRLLVVLLLALMVPAVVFAGRQLAASIHGPTTLRLVSNRAAFSLPARPALGQSFVVNGDVFDSHGTPVGDELGVCTIVKIERDGPTASCSNVFRLAEGDLRVGMVCEYSLGDDYPTTSISIVGGTGEYSSARGDGVTRLTDARSHTRDWTLYLAL
jgi:hypothetical protein